MNIGTVTTKEQQIIPPRRRNLPPHLWGKGVSGNPAGRPKGSRNKLAEHFVADLLADWQEHGADAVAECRVEDPATYLRVVASLVPKELHFKEGDSTLEAFLEQFSGKELDSLIAGLIALGTIEQGKGLQVKEDTGGKPDGVHKVLLPGKKGNLRSGKPSRTNR